jgi:hypothetical protein
MTLNIVVAVWGAWYRKVFLDKALATLLDPSNLPSMGIDCRLIVYTNESHLSEFIELEPAVRKYVPCEIRSMQLPDGYKTAWQDAALKAGEDDLMVFLQADIVWSKGAFAHIANLIKAGKKLIYIPHMRGTEPFYPKYALTGEELMRIVAEDAHPLNKAQEVNQSHFTHHPETVLWPVKGGWVARLFAREPLVCPAWMRFNGHNLPALPVDRNLIALVESTDQACAVSLSRRDAEWDHYRSSTLQAEPERVGDFSIGHKSSVTAPVAELYSFLRYGEVDPDEVKRAVAESREFADKAVLWTYGPKGNLNVLSLPKKKVKRG